MGNSRSQQAADSHKLSHEDVGRQECSMTHSSIFNFQVQHEDSLKASKDYQNGGNN